MSRFRNLTKRSKNDKIGPFLDADKVLETAQRCDLIEFQREKYVHWGMYIGEDCIIHLCNLGNGIGKVQMDLFVDVANGDKCRINNKEKMVQKWSKKPHKDFIERDPDEVIALARTMFDVKLDYNVVTKNCEHLCTKWKYGVSSSIQVNFRKPNIVSLSWYHTYVNELEGCAFLKIVLHIKRYS
jgi:hypothetical protein